MKKKFLILSLCFTLVFTSINFKKSYADGGIISAPMVGVVITLASATGIVFNNDEDIVEFANMFYQKNKDNWDEFNRVFNACVKIGANGVVTVGKQFLDKVLNFFDILKVTIDGSLGSIDTLGGLTIGANYKYSDFLSDKDETYIFDGVNIYISSLDSTLPLCIWVTGTSTSGYVHLGYIDSSENRVLLNRYSVSSLTKALSSTISLIPASTESSLPGHMYLNLRIGTNGYKNHYNWFSTSTLVNDFTAQGTYDKTLVNDNLNNDGSVGVYVPSDVGSIVGSNPSDVVYDGVLDPPYDLPVNGVVSTPIVSNPSISIDGSVSLPNAGATSKPENPALPALPSWGDGLDFSPITNGVFVDKFPFCLAKDVSDIISVFDVEPKAPVFKFPFVSEELVFDLTEFELWFDIMRFFILIGFIISLIVLTRGIIG